VNNILKTTVGLVLNFRTASKTIKCLQSLIREGITNIIIVDNSEDDSASLGDMQGDLAKLVSDGVSVDILTTGKNQGFAKGVNYGFRFAKEKSFSYVILVNSDAYFELGSLTAMTEAMKNSAICIPKTKSAETSATSSLFGYYHSAIALNFSQKRSSCLKYASGCCMLISTECFNNDLLDEDFFFYGEDVELGYRMKKLSLQSVECSEATIIHEGSGSAKKGSLFYEYHINRSHWLTATKFGGHVLTRFYFRALRCLTLTARCILRCIRYKNLTPLHGYSLAIYDLLLSKKRTLTPLASRQ